MKALLQRVLWAKVEVEGRTVGEISPGLLVFLGVAEGDQEKDLQYMQKKIPALRIFPDEEAKMNLSLKEKHYPILLVSQFTLCADTKAGNRPSFFSAAKPELAKAYYEKLQTLWQQEGITVATGLFGADMKVSLCNDGPVTISLDSRG